MALGSMDILTRLILLIHRPELSFHLFVYSTLYWIWDVLTQSLKAKTVTYCQTFKDDIPGEYCWVRLELHTQHVTWGLLYMFHWISSPWVQSWGMQPCSLIAPHFPIPRVFTDPLLCALTLGKIAWSFNRIFWLCNYINLFNKFQCFLLNFWVLFCC